VKEIIPENRAGESVGEGGRLDCVPVVVVQEWVWVKVAVLAPLPPTESVAEGPPVSMVTEWLWVVEPPVPHAVLAPLGKASSRSVYRSQPKGKKNVKITIHHFLINP
jgi:hypothetical protein